MASLEDLKAGASVKGLTPNGIATVVQVHWFGDQAVEVTFKDGRGELRNRLVYRNEEPNLEIVTAGRPWAFDGDGKLLRLVSEAYRIHLAHLFDPYLAVHTSLIEPLPHQITAVYGEMLPRQPLRFLLADDPGAGKTIMAGLLIKELIIRGDLERCLVVAPSGLVEQWQDELSQKFDLSFDILTRDRIEAARTGNPFSETNLLIARLDMLSRNPDLQALLQAGKEWDVVICDEAHRMAASFYGSEIKFTKRYQLGQLLAGHCRHFLLMTATPHNGKEEDFQLFMALLDGDRFEGRFRDGVHKTDVSDMIRRMVKEELLKFDGTPLFPERRAYTVKYELSDEEAALYSTVTNYVREEMNRAERFAEGDNKRRQNVGFALTILQRRLASSPAAIHESLKRRLKRMEDRLAEERLLKRGAEVPLSAPMEPAPTILDDPDDFEEASEEEVEEAEEAILDQATAAQTIAELQAEIVTLKGLETQARRVRRSGNDTKWTQLNSILDDPLMTDANGNQRKLIVFTEPRDTLEYLAEKIRLRLGKHEAVVVIHGGVTRENRRKAVEAFNHDKDVFVMVANDAAGEGINLQRAHLMVNYDLPWNPNRIEQRFGRIHRIGQTEVCHLWNLVATDTREGEVYSRLLEKLETARAALGGRVYDVLGQLFEARALRDLLMEAIRYGEQPEVRERLFTVVDEAVDEQRLLDLLEERALAHAYMDKSRLQEIREQMDRAAARRLQPHFIRTFFIEAFKHLGGQIKRREAGRWEITRVPGPIRERDRQIGIGEPVLERYERVCFDKDKIAGPPMAAFVCPGHPLLDATIDLILERYRDLMKRGAVLIDDGDDGEDLRALFYLEHAVQDGRTGRTGQQQVVSQRLQFVEVFEDGRTVDAGPAPYLDYRPVTDDERERLSEALEAPWLAGGIEQRVMDHAIQHIIPAHVEEVRARREREIEKVEQQVRERLQKEINYWDHRAQQLKDQERAGKKTRLSAANAEARANDMADRLQRRLAELGRERDITARPPIVRGGAIIVPVGMLQRLSRKTQKPSGFSESSQEVELLAMDAVMEAERSLGFEPRDVSAGKYGYDIESREIETGRLRFIEVKGRADGADTVFVTRNEILTALNNPDDFILGIVSVSEGFAHEPCYVRRPFSREPDFGATSVVYKLKELLERGEAPN